MSPPAIRRLLIAVVALAVLSGTAQAEMQWSRRRAGGISLDAPKGWTVALDERGAIEITGTLRMSYRGAKPEDIKLVVARDRRGAGDTAGSLLQDLVATADDARVLESNHGKTGAAAVLGRSDATNVGLRIVLDGDGAGYGYGLVITERHWFGSGDLMVEPMAILDRVLLSMTTPTTGATSSTSWTLRATEIGEDATYVPGGWKASKVDGGVFMFDGKRVEDAHYGVVLLSVKAPIDDLRGAPLLEVFDKVIGVRAHRVAPFHYGETTDYVELVAFRDADGADGRAAIYVTRNRTRIDIAFVTAEAPDFYRADLPAAGRVIHESRGIAKRGLRGTWTAGHTDTYLFYFDPKGDWVDTTADAVRMAFSFDGRGGYTLVYRYHADFRGFDAQVYSREKGTYTFDGLQLTLRPKTRTVADLVNGKRSQKTYKSGLPKVVLDVRRMGDDLAFTGKRLKWLGMWPTLPKEDVDTLYFERAPDKKLPKSGFGTK